MVLSLFYCVVSKNADTDIFDRNAVKTYFATLLKRPDSLMKNTDKFAEDAKIMENAKSSKIIDTVNDSIQPPPKQNPKYTTNIVKPLVTVNKAGVKRKNITPEQNKTVRTIKRQAKLQQMQHSKSTARMVIPTITPSKVSLKRDKITPTQLPDQQSKPSKVEHSKGATKKVKPPFIPSNKRDIRSNITPTQAPKQQSDPPKEQHSNGTAKITKPVIKPNNTSKQKPEKPTQQSKDTMKMKPTVIATKAEASKAPEPQPKQHSEKPKTQRLKSTAKLAEPTVIPAKTRAKRSNASSIQAPKKRCVRNYKITRINGKFGFKYEMRNDYLQVVEVEPKSPADRKLIVNDQIIAINKIAMDKYVTNDELNLLFDSDVLALKISREV